ncbi:MAG: AzlC family ABC transporter permease [Clostridia bacterium]|nr:AzlC family ABC transporter permease [Clostridia bacterium]
MSLVIILEKQNTYRAAYKAAFPHTLPVLTGYLFIGIAFGVMFADKGYNFLWAGLMSLLVYAGSGQYLAVNFFDPSVSLLQVIFLTFMVNVRHIFYGLSLLEKFKVSGKKKPYMIFSLTDETYSLYFLTKTPENVDEGKFLFAIATLDQSYWVIGSIIGGVAGTLIPFDSTGIDFAMTALFIVIFVEQWLQKKNRFPAMVGVVSSVICLLIFGKDSFILPSMIIIMIILLANHRIEQKKGNATND